MSFSLVYDKQFIKVEVNGVTRYAPVMLCGSSNVYDHYGKRDRSWNHGFTLQFGSGLYTKQEVLTSVQAFIDPYCRQYPEKSKAEIHNSFGYYSGIAVNGSTHKTTFKKFQSMYRTGMAKALTVEQLIEEGVTIKAVLKVDQDMTITNSEELINLFITGTKFYITFPYSSDRLAIRMRRKYFQKPVREKKEKRISKVYKIMVGQHLGYFKKETSRQVRYNMYGKEFLSRTKAMNKIKHMEAKNYSVKFTLCEFDVDKVVLV
jgi:hypothetical protein